MKMRHVPAFLLLTVAVIAAGPDGGVTVTIPDKPDQFHQLWDAMCGKYGWLAALSAWIGSSRMACKIFGDKLKAAMESLLSAAVSSHDEQVVARVSGILNSRTYRFTAFVFDWITSIKLPSSLPAKQP